MNSKIVINKKGSYILEASIALPFFMIAVIIVNSIVLMYQTIENANYIIATEIRRTAAEAMYTNTSALIPLRIQQRVNENNSIVKRFDLQDFGYRVDRLNQDELILIKYRLNLRTNNPLNIAAEANYDLACVTRAYVGKERELDNMSIEEMLADGSAVYIFPKRGEKYHKKGCAFLTAASKSGILTEAIKSKYDSCPVCHSKTAKIGELCYYFPQDGESYHLPGCPTLERNYIELEKRVAVKRGYTACSKCGG